MDPSQQHSWLGVDYHNRLSCYFFTTTAAARPIYKYANYVMQHSRCTWDFGLLLGAAIELMGDLTVQDRNKSKTKRCIYRNCAKVFWGRSHVLFCFPFGSKQFISHRETIRRFPRFVAIRQFHKVTMITKCLKQPNKEATNIVIDWGGSILSLERNQNQNAGNVNSSEFCVSVERTNKLQGKTNSK